MFDAVVPSVLDFARSVRTTVAPFVSERWLDDLAFKSLDAAICEMETRYA